MTIEERAARLYLAHKGIDPERLASNWKTELAATRAEFERLSLMLYFLKQAENTK